MSGTEAGRDSGRRGADAVPAALDILIPTFSRPLGLAVTLTSLIGQTFRDFRVVVSDQSDDPEASWPPPTQAVLRLLRARDQPVERHHHLPRRGLAEQRQFLLDRATAPYVLFLDDDVILEPDLIARLIAAIRRERCGFVGSAVIGLSYLHDERPEQQAIAFWNGPVQPEDVRPGSEAWQRHRLHNAANLYHLQRRLALPPGASRLYRVAWIGGCVLYDTEKLRAAGGFTFWRELPPEHCGEDVLAQLRVMRRFGGCGLLPSGACHQELPTTVPNREVDAPLVLR